MATPIRIPGLSIRVSFLMIFVLLVATPLSLFWAWPVSRAMQNELDQVHNKHLLLAQNLGSALQRYHRDVISTFNYFAAKSTSESLTSQADQILKNLHFRHICTADAKTGIVTIGFGELHAKCPKQIGPKKLVHFRKFAVEGETNLTGVMAGPTGEPMIFLVRLSQGRLAIGGLMTGYFVELGKTIAFGIKGHAAIVDQYGSVLAHPLPSWVAAMKNISKVSAVKRMLAGETGVQTFYSPALKDDMIAGFTSVKGAGWGVMIPQPMSELRQAAKGVQSSAFGVFAIGLLLALIVSLLVATPILRPLAALVRGVKRMEDGESNVQLDTSGALVPRELRTLLTSFNTMTARVSSAHNKAMADSEQQFQNLVEGSLQGVFIHQGTKILFANQATADIFGYKDPQQLQALADVKRLAHPCEYERLDKFKHARETNNYAPDTYEAKALRKDGGEIWIELRITLIDWHGVQATQCAVLDITERKHSEHELMTHRDQLQYMVVQATEDLEEKAEELKKALGKEKDLNELQRQFVSMASHEFRTPLAIIDGTAQRLASLAERNKLSPEAAVKRSNKVRAAVKRMTRLMESTLSVARMDEGKIKLEIDTCKIGKLIRGACQRHQEIAKDHKISFKLKNLPDTMQVDGGALEQILTNLLSNAVKYAPSSPQIDVTAVVEGQNLVLSVRDYGVGIDQNELSRLGERFFRAGTSTGIAGTGIGLSLVKDLLEMHNGSLDVQSAKDEGSTFTIRLPLAGPTTINQSLVDDAA